MNKQSKKISAEVDGRVVGYVGRPGQKHVERKMPAAVYGVRVGGHGIAWTHNYLPEMMAFAKTASMYTDDVVRVVNETTGEIVVEYQNSHVKYQNNITGKVR